MIEKYDGMAIIEIWHLGSSWLGCFASRLSVPGTNDCVSYYGGSLLKFTVAIKLPAFLINWFAATVEE